MLSVFQHDYKEFWFCLEVTQSPCLLLMSCEIVEEADTRGASLGVTETVSSPDP